MVEVDKKHLKVCKARIRNRDMATSVIENKETSHLPGCNELLGPT
jgi:hypothetical protein